MRIHEFGREHEKTILLIHPAAARWDYFSGVIPLLALLIPALPGYNEAAPKEDYTSVEEIAESLADWLLGQGLNEVDVGYGCAMGGSILLAMLAKGRVHILTSVLDGGITPGTLTQPLGRLLAAGDALRLLQARSGNTALLAKVVPPGAAEPEKILRALSGRTIWRTCISCRTYQLEGTLSEKPIHLKYWFGEAEERERAWDLRFVEANVPGAKLFRMRGTRR
ncbi:MAG: alpha/beta hydrolase [Lachnospiraceae bacterium]|jgi:pimeloyl-ACP methyl ester carboxylesterase|nr:alpha/beta hydrolase [Lachnospiraceae bacterium]MCI1424748.1 alpha/beta hydrolase [Lachnospiraceae bacterium]